MSFRDRLIATLRAVAPVLQEPGVLIVGSEKKHSQMPDPEAERERVAMLLRHLDAAEP